ncbi:MAG: DinB family protein [Chitinophagaceae bacterium]
MKILLSQFSAYHLWASQQLLDVIQPLPQELKDQNIVSSFGSISNTLRHMWDAESIWWQRMKLQEQIVRPSDTFSGSFDELSAALMAQGKLWHEWIMSAQEYMLDHEFIYYNSKKEKFKQAVYQVLLHLFNHATYHRGQLVTMLRQLGVTNIPPTDFIVWSRKKYTGMSSK